MVRLLLLTILQKWKIIEPLQSSLTIYFTLKTVKFSHMVGEILKPAGCSLKIGDSWRLPYMISSLPNQETVNSLSFPRFHNIKLPSFFAYGCMIT